MKIATYRTHSLWLKVTEPIIHIILAVDFYLWDKAHYQNGKGQDLGVPKMSLREAYRVTGDYTSERRINYDI